MKAMRKSGQRSAVSGQLPSVEVFILAGGLSTRMGRDKARLRLGGRTLLAWVRSAARETGWPVRVVRRDLVPRCGPIGGVWTALRRSRAERLVFLSCDMPFVTAQLIRAVAQRKGRGVFVETGEGVGFPFALDRAAGLPVVEAAIEARRFSIQAFARSLRASRFKPSRAERDCFQNLNTPEDYEQAVTRDVKLLDAEFDTIRARALTPNVSQP